MKGFLRTVIKMISLLCLLAILCSCSIFPTTADANENNGGNESNDINDSSIRLTVEESKVSYSEESKTYYAPKLSDLIGRIIFIKEGLTLTQKEKLDLEGFVTENIFPILEEAKISEANLDALTEITNTELENNGGHFFSLLSNIYTKSSAILPGRSQEILLYRLCELYFLTNEKTCLDRYEKYGYAWYLEDAKKFSDGKALLTQTLGEEAFSVTVGFCFFTYSAANGSLLGGLAEYTRPETDNTAQNSEAFSDNNTSENRAQESDMLLLTDAELVTLIRRQAQYFGNNVSEEQWTAAMTLLIDFCFAGTKPPEQLSEIMQAEWTALGDSDKLAEAAGRLMPSLLDLYASLSEVLTKEDIPRLYNADEKDALKLELCKILSRCPDAVDKLTACVLSIGNVSCDAETKAMARWQDELEDFSDGRKKADEKALSEAINNAAQGNGSLNEVNESLLDLLFSLDPYLAFAIWEGGMTE